MKILLTGGTGFLGRALLTDFLARGCTVIVVSRGGASCVEVKGEGVPYELCGTSLESLSTAFRKHPDIDVVVHAATDYGRSAKLPTGVFEGNVEFPVRLLDLAMNSSVGLFVNIDTFFNVKNSKYQYLGEYALSKRHFQEWGEVCARQGRLRFVNLCLYHLFGPGDGAEKFITSVINDCLRDAAIDLTDGYQRRDFIFVDDAVGAVTCAVKAEFGKAAGYVHYDVGSGTSCSIRELVELIKRLSNSRSVLNFGALASRIGEFSNARADVRSLKEIGWIPKTCLEDGLRATIDSCRSNINIGA